MTNRLLAVSLLAAALPLAGCGELDETAKVTAPAVEIAGEPVDCVHVSEIRNTVVQDDYTIDFVLPRGKVYRNTLPNRCPGLGFEQRFAYEVRGGQLCRIETIQVLRPDGLRGPACGLGEFVPVRYADTGA